jgi:hypothetical protein
MSEIASPILSFAICMFSSMLALYARGKIKADAAPRPQPPNA